MRSSSRPKGEKKKCGACDNFSVVLKPLPVRSLPQTDKKNKNKKMTHIRMCSSDAHSDVQMLHMHGPTHVLNMETRVTRREGDC